MYKWFFPNETNFFVYFEKHASLIVQATSEFSGLVKNPEEIKNRTLKITQIEHEADKTTHACIEELHKSFITPFQREDIHRLISKMDDVVDLIKESTQRISIYEVKIIPKTIIDMVDLLGKAAIAVQKIILSLHDKGSERQDLFIEINKIENEADKVHIEGLKKLFEDSQDTKLIIKWKEIYDLIEESIDRCEDVANIVEGMILEST